MGKIAFVFSGQGAQYAGMGREISELYPAAAAVFAMADRLRPGTSAQCFDGSAGELALTLNTQPCLLAVELACAAGAAEAGIVPEGAAGFSLGEIAALGFGGVLSGEDSFSLVCKRAEIMDICAAQNPGGMAAVLRLESGEVEELCRSFSKVWPVNYNCPGQTVVAGEAGELEEFIAALKQKGGRAIKLDVSGAFHSPFMAAATDQMAEILKGYSLNTPRIPVYSNLTAAPYSGDMAGLISRQISNPVKWEQTIRNMINDGFDTFIEMGPKAVLCGLISKISGDVTALSFGDAAGAEEALAVLSGEIKHA